MGKRAVLLSLTEPSAILYRQRILADCLERRQVIRGIYELAVEAVVGKKKAYGFHFRDSPDTILTGSLNVLEFYLGVLKRLRHIAGEHACEFESEGFGRFFAMIQEELDEDYLEVVEHHLKELRFRRGVLMSAKLGKGNKGRDYVVRKPRERSLIERLPVGSRSSYSFTIPDRDENGFRALSELRGKGLNLVANARSRSQRTTSRASSACCERSSRSMSAASTCGSASTR